MQGAFYFSTGDTLCQKMSYPRAINDIETIYKPFRKKFWTFGNGCGNCCVGGGSMTTLENLYNGNINPSDLDELKYNPEYSRALNRVCAARQKLSDSLSAEQRELLERYIANAD